MKRKKVKAATRTVDEVLADAREHRERGDLATAERGYREVLAREPRHLGAIALLGLLLIDLDHIDAAIALLDDARGWAPDFAPVQLALGSAYAVAGHDALAVAAMEHAVRTDPSSTIALERLARHHLGERRPREAIGLLRRIVRREPDHEAARFLLAGLGGEPARATDAASAATPPSPPSALIADLFDTYAPRFDVHLVDQLRYRVPAELAAEVAALAGPPAAAWHVLDLGCGTGLSGVAMRPFARTLIGSDLSVRMVQRAKARAIYDELHVEDLAVTLARAEGVADLVVAADVFIYVGALEATFAATARALRPGGWFAFSTEDGDRDLALMPSFRYCHAPAYIARLAAAHGFAIARATTTVLRTDAGADVAGTLNVLRRT